jgi:hypothetical protein
LICLRCRVLVSRLADRAQKLAAARLLCACVVGFGVGEAADAVWISVLRISAILFGSPQPVAHDSQHESQQPDIWRQDEWLKAEAWIRHGGGWRGMEKVRRMWKEFGVALTGSGALGHAARVCLTWA